MSDKELDDWANTLDQISSNISDISFELRDDEYKAKRVVIIQKLEKQKAELDKAIAAITNLK